jgi:hypothetical protein
MLIYLALILPILLWLILRFTMSPGPYNMDPCGKGTFFPHLIMYSVFGYVIVALSAIGATWGIARGLNWHPALVLLFAGIDGLLFAGFLTFFYEGWMAVRYPGIIITINGLTEVKMNGTGEQLGKSNYTLDKYALILSLGVSSVTLLIVGAVWTAAEVGR